MGGIKDILFGTKPEVQTRPAEVQREWKYTPEQRKLLSRMLGYVSPTIGQVGAAYPGQFVAGLSPMEQLSMETLSGYMGKFTSPEEYYSTIVEKPLLKAWREEIMPELRGEYGRKGLFLGSGREKAELRSAETLMDILARGRVGAEATTLQNILGVTGAGMEYGGVERGIEQMGLTTAYEDWLRTQPGMTPEMGLAMRLLGISPYQMFESDVAVYPGTEGLMPSMIEAAGPIAAALIARG